MRCVAVDVGVGGGVVDGVVARADRRTARVRSDLALGTDRLAIPGVSTLKSPVPAKSV